MAEALFGEDFLRRLEMLRLALVRSAGSQADGLRLAGPSGGTGEFRDHRDYAFGDEPRYIDWNLYGRLEKLYLKEFTPEHEGRALVLLDTSASMTAGQKFDYARRLAAAVSYLASAGGDRLALVAFNSQRAVSLSPRPGPSGMYETLEFIASLKPGGSTGYRSGAERGAEAAAGRGRGAALWISDFWVEPGEWQDSASLSSRGFDSSLIRVLSGAELTPRTSGPLVLVDSESGERLRVAGGEASARAFEVAAGEHAAALASFARRHRCRLLTARTSEPFEDSALRLLRGGRLVEAG